MKYGSFLSSNLRLMVLQNANYADRVYNETCEIDMTSQVNAESGSTGIRKQSFFCWNMNNNVCCFSINVNGVEKLV